jgi:ubiquinone/menaquinone biosynthesis C-methylase UbiE
MKRSTLELLCCPRCRAELEFRNGSGHGPVEAGVLFCSQCERTFPIRKGIPHFIDAEALRGINRRFARFYDRLSPVYAFLTKIGFLGFGGERKARKEVLDRMELGGGRTLEVSIGSGENLPYLLESPNPGEIYGLDISAGQLERCRSFITRRGWAVDLFLGTAEALPFKAETFDGVLHIGGINFFSGKKQAIEEMIRVARPGSKIVIADESEDIARNMYRISRLFRPRQGEKVDTRVPIHLVPDTMQDKHVDGIWKSHGKYHGYCLEFRKPA